MTVDVSEVRNSFHRYLRSSKNESVVIVDKGKPVAVLLSVEEFVWCYGDDAIKFLNVK